MLPHVFVTRGLLNNGIYFQFSVEGIFIRKVKICQTKQNYLKKIKDFAKSIQVKEGNEIELFWKWYLVKDEEAEDLVKKIIGKEEKVIEKPVEEKPKEEKEIEEKKQKIKEKVKKEVKPDLGLQNVHEYFSNNNIKILNADVINKNKETYVTKDDKPIDENDRISLPISQGGAEHRWYWSKETFTNRKHDLIVDDTKPKRINIKYKQRQSIFNNKESINK